MGTGCKLLLADDSITIQKVVNLTFIDEGLEVTTVGDGDLAIEKIEEIIPDIVLADIHMPGLNGYEVCEFVKRNERFRHIPVMLLVGSFEPYDEAEARRVGADDHLTKPFQSIRQLVSKVSDLLRGTSASDETPTKELDEQSDEQSDAQSLAREHSETAQPLTSTVPLGAETLDPVAFTSEDDDDAFADPSLDDAMIEATPAGDFSLEGTIGTSRATTPLNSTDLEQAGAHRAMPSEIHTQDTLRMLASDVVHESGLATAADADHPAPSAKAFAADDALLDLGDDEPQFTTGGQDDFILDIWDEAPIRAALSSSAPAESPIVQYDGDLTEMSAHSAVPVAAEVVEAVRLVEMTPLRNLESEAVSVDPVVDAYTTPPPHAGMITLEQVSPEVIDAIARRAVEQLSEKVVEQIAWEVVPDLAERLIKRRLEQEGKV